jgi:hypothetical protein
MEQRVPALSPMDQGGVVDAMLETLANLAGQDQQAHMADSTVIRTHHCAVGIKGDSIHIWSASHECPRALVSRRHGASGGSRG